VYYSVWQGCCKDATGSPNQGPRRRRAQKQTKKQRKFTQCLSNIGWSDIDVDKELDKVLDLLWVVLSSQLILEISALILAPTEIKADSSNFGFAFREI
jgi:hypothetical protein